MKKKGALLALVSGKSKGESGLSSDEEFSAAKKYSKGEDDGDSITNGGASFDAAATSLALTMGIEESLRPKFKEAFREAVHACVRGYKSSDEEE